MCFHHVPSPIHNRHYRQAAGESAHDSKHELLVLQQEGAVLAPPRDVLRAAQVQVDAVAYTLDIARSFQQYFRVMPTKLDEQGAIFCGAQVLTTVTALFGMC